MDWKSLPYLFINAPISFGGIWDGAEDGPDVLVKKLKIPSELVTSTKRFTRSQYKNQSSELFEVVKFFAKEISQQIEAIFSKNKIPVIFGGDHSLSIASMATFLRYKTNIGVIHIDAHPDSNSPATTQSHNIHGMVYGATCFEDAGYLEPLRGAPAPKLPTHALCFLGIREIDPPEQKLINDLNIWNRTTQDILQIGAAVSALEAADYLKMQGITQVIISFDIDVLDPKFAPASGLPYPRGLKPSDVHAIFEVLNRELDPIAYEFVEFAPVRDMYDSITERTYVTIIQSALTKVR